MKPSTHLLPKWSTALILLSVSTSPATYYGWRRGYRWAASPYQDTEVRSYSVNSPT